MAKVFPTIVGDDGLTYYQIQKGQILYRGDTGIYLSRGEMPNVPAFFGILKKRVAPYGMVFTFETKKPLKLLALDLHEENKLLLDPTFTTDSKIRKILLEQYGFQNGLRDTVREKDHKLLKYLCSLGMDGYYINEMDVPGDVPIDPFEDDGKKDTDPSKFHSEIGLCNVNQNVELVNYQADVLNYTSEQREAARLKKIAIDKNMKTQLSELKPKKEVDKKKEGLINLVILLEFQAMVQLYLILILELSQVTLKAQVHEVVPKVNHFLDQHQQMNQTHFKV